MQTHSYSQLFEITDFYMVTLGKQWLRDRGTVTMGTNSRLLTNGIKLNMLVQ